MNTSFMHIFYRSLMPHIPHCVAFGQTAGTALSINDGTGLKEVNYRALQDSLTKQGVPLPGVYSAL